MQIDLRTVSIKPLRQTFDQIVRHTGADKPASRYLEGTIRVQAECNFHYRPLWDPDHEIFDPSRTAVKVKDWYAFKDPRQFYYGTYTLARARMQETAEADFAFVEERGLADSYPPAARQRALEVLLPLRHVAWGSNMNNSAICAYGYGTAITQPCLYHAMDQLGIAQYLTRIGLLFADAAELDAAKTAWLERNEWQPMRRFVEDSFVIADWFEQYVAQNLALDGLLYPLIYKYFDEALTAEAGPTVSMLLRFQADWYAETSKWVDSCIKAAAAENNELIGRWVRHWRDRALEAVTPIAGLALGSKAESILAEATDQFNARVARMGVAL